MSSQMKEEERIERIIRGLLKLPDNRRCINCNSSGPQYVCTTFWTFVCMNCSGIHREFTHRVKSVSMAKFTAQEVSCLQAGGNERARQIYFKTWDPSRNFCPDGSNLNKLRDFIKHVYVDRKFSGDKSQEKSPIAKSGSRDLYDERRSFERSIPGGKEVFGERHSFESFSLGDRRWHDKSSRGSKEDLNDRCYLEKHNNAARKNEDRNLRYGIDQTRSPRYTQPKSRPARFEIVDDRFREDGSGNVKRYEHYRFTKTESKRQSRSPDSQRASTEPTHPVVCPIKDILGDQVVKLEVGDPPEPKEANVQNNGESTKSSDSVKPINLIDFEDDLQPPASASTQSTQQPPASTSSSEKASTNVDSTESLLLLGMSPAASPTVATDMTSPAPVPADSTTAHQENVPQDSNAGNDQKHSGRNELPAELFTSSYSPFLAAAPGWMEYGMHYHPHHHARMMLSAKSRNPFDVCDESSQVPAPMLPSMLPLQGTPNVLPSPHPQQSPYALAPPLPSTSYGMVVLPGAYVGPQLPNNLLMRGYQEHNNSETGESPFALLNPLHQSSSSSIPYMTPDTSSHSSSTRTNPFSY
ncbi:hypothetical protein DM860_007710 [Cuscuta australis]|uniref:Arf-GAP domain-containing protein n=1 Tax=Cuscuta australis TaxID=267555 RepID=A0A328E4K9_9ASTE|nr:hypothetical protein DM860_007710 [Cuscuta australis]